MEVIHMNDLMEDQKVEEILKETGLNWRVNPVPLDFTYGMSRKDSGYIGLIHSSTEKCLHAAKPGYNISQNDELVRIALKACEKYGELSVQRGGSLNGGKKTFLQLAIEGNSHVKGDKIKRYLTILDSNDGTSAISFGYGNQTASCTNEFSRFLKARHLKIYHNKDLEEKLKEVPAIIDYLLSQDYRLIEIYNELAEWSIHKDLAHELVKGLIGIDRTMTKEQLEEMEIKTRKLNIMNSLYDNIDKEIRGKGENLWGLFSGITSYTTHDASVPKRKFGRAESSFIGSVNSMNNKALDFVMEKADLEW